jgi:hypothetical protein
MAATTSIITGPEVPGNRKMTTATVTFDASYATGGEAIAVSDLGFVRLDFLAAAAGQGYLARWDGSTSSPKILFGDSPGFRSVNRSLAGVGVSFLSTTPANV